MTIRRHHSLLWLAVVLLLIYWAARLFSISAFPPFLDEGIHVSFGRDIMRMGPLAHASEGRQFAIWLYVLFGAQANEPFLISRIANLFVLLLGVAAVIGTGRLLSNRWGGLLAVLFIIASAYHHFFDRLALGDTPAAAAVILAVYFAARLSKRISYVDAVLYGIALFIACGLKLSTIPYFAIPIIAVFAFQRNQRGIQWATAALSIACGLIAAYFGIVAWRGYDPFALLVQQSSVSHIQIFLVKAAQLPQMVVSYFGVPLTILLMIALLSLLSGGSFSCRFVFCYRCLHCCSVPVRLPATLLRL